MTVLWRPSLVFVYGGRQSRFEWQFFPVKVNTMSIEESDKAAAAVAKAPRVSLKDIEAAIDSRYDFNAGVAIANGVGIPAAHESLDVLSICLLVMKNGFTVIGKSAPASADNYDMELGIQFAYEDAVRQLWPLMGYALREKLASAQSASA